MLNPRHSREPGLYRSLCAANSRPGTRCAIQGHRTAMSKITNEFSEFVLFSEDENRCLVERRIQRDVRDKPIGKASCWERVCQYGYVAVVAGTEKKTKITT